MGDGNKKNDTGNRIHDDHYSIKKAETNRKWNLNEGDATYSHIKI